MYHSLYSSLNPSTRELITSHLNKNVNYTPQLKGSLANLNKFPQYNSLQNSDVAKKMTSNLLNAIEYQEKQRETSVDLNKQLKSISLGSICNLNALNEHLTPEDQELLSKLL